MTEGKRAPHTRPHSREHRRTGKADGGKDMRRRDAGTCPDSVDKTCWKQIGQKLRCEIGGNQKGHLTQRKTHLLLEDYEKERDEIVDDRLCDESQITGTDSAAVSFHPGLPN